MIVRCIAAICLLVAASGCASKGSIRLADNPETSLLGKQLHSAREAPPYFLALSPNHVAFGLMGAASAYSAGNRLVIQEGIEDPAVTIEDAILDHLRNRHGTDNGDPLVFGDDKPRNLAGWARENDIRDLIVDVTTDTWGFSFQGSDFSSNVVGYSATFRLIESATGDVLAQHVCRSESDEAPSREALLTNGAILLKALLNRGAQNCIAEITTQVL